MPLPRMGFSNISETVKIEMPIQVLLDTDKYALMMFLIAHFSPVILKKLGHRGQDEYSAAAATVLNRIEDVLK